MAHEIVGILSLLVFVFTVLGPLIMVGGRRLIPLPLQSLLVVGALVNIVMTVVAIWLDGGSLSEMLSLGSAVGSNVILLPIMAMAGGFLVAGALEGSGGFAALRVVINKMRGTPLGMAGTLVFIAQFSTIFAMPCGRIAAAALLPVIITLGPEGVRLINKKQMVVLVTALAVNAAASCGPSQIGGIGQIGEGFLQQLGFLTSSQEFGIMIGTAFTALFISLFVTRFDLDEKIRLTEGRQLAVSSVGAAASTDTALAEKHDEEVIARKFKAPLVGYISLIIFLVALVGAVFGLFGKTPITTTLLVATVVIMLIARLSIRQVISGIILHPITALVAGFLMAGSLAVSGGFKSLSQVLVWLSEFKVAGVGLGVAGMIALFVQLETIMPMPCGRILAAALLPIVVAMGPATGWMPNASGLLTYNQLAIVLAAFIVNAAASCGPSPIGGIGTISEGMVRSDIGYLRNAQSYGIMAAMTPLAALVMRFLVLTHNPFRLENLLIFFGLLFGLFVFNLGMIKLVNPATFKKRRTPTQEKEKSLATWVAFLLGGVFSGMVITFTLFWPDQASGFASSGPLLVYLLQGAVGGAIAGALLLLT
ncbi:MAG: hypothetical protein A2Y64_00950 [Candidatus Coatesbacteria bacterium RBG_13_66_14]|uniref:Uncharacterized protein n=1 Tax=Candidatus Coatesbacteria bacterium RBG_13_66_14 TaxID=1817816 RepID=A0A1F5F4P4_9BACT|nr:MAG: hypothetical protein A2Y64_00950 [Candidatus Coatesbacteria bacterium RBG_13_66_14]